MELKLEDVQRALSKLVNHYPEAGHNGQTLSRLAADWLDLLGEEEVTKSQFSAGIRHAVKTCKFFPKVADVLEGVRAHRANPKPKPKSEALQIADRTSQHDPTPEEVAMNNERLNTIAQMLAGKLSMDDAVNRVEELTTIKEFFGRAEA